METIVTQGQVAQEGLAARPDATLEDELSLPIGARRLIAVAALVGAAVLIWALTALELPDVYKFAGFLGVAVFSSGMHLAVPGIRGTLSLTFLFVLFGIVELTLPETVLLAGAAAVAQCYWEKGRRARPVQIVFHVSQFMVAAAVTGRVYTSDWLLHYQLEPAIRLAVATMALFLVNTGPVALITALSEGERFAAVWRTGYLWTFPYYLGGAAVAQFMVVADKYFGWQTVLLTGPVVYLIFRSYQLYLERLEDEKRHAEEVSSLHLRTIEALALAIEAKDNTTHEHLQRVQVYAMSLGKDLGLDEPNLEALRAAALLHDIGKLAVPEHIISKPGRLTPEEFEKMKIHPVVGAEILERVQFPYPVVPIVRAHHEKWDGTGYPSGLAGEAIPIGARILSAVDCLDALATDRQYRRAIPLDEAMKVVQSESGKAFDPRVVDLLMKRYVELEKKAQAEGAKAAKRTTEIKMRQGVAPAAGFVSEGKAAPKKEGDFLTSIAAARHEVQALFEISQDLGNSLSLDETLSVLGVRLRRIIPHATLAIWVKRDGNLVPEYVGGEEYRVFSTLQIPLGQGLSGWVAENGKPILNGNPAVEPGHMNDPNKFSNLRSAVAVPLEASNGVLGVLSLYHAEKDAFTKDHLRILLGISNKLGIAIENAIRFRQVESSATTDFLTSLPNARSLFIQLDAELARSRRDQATFALLVLDLDGFKQVNDRHGHLVGNKVLRDIAAGLKSACREYDYVARLGGDEFVALLPGVKPFDVETKVHQFREVVAHVCRHHFGDGVLTASIGVTNYPHDGADAEELLSEADRRMYQEKRGHKHSRSAMDPGRAEHARQFQTVH
jgi:diguanylate cyclase (GGDEF)-like protein/putative nucleotidyltransferase with HDIG domain